MSNAVQPPPLPPPPPPGVAERTPRWPWLARMPLWARLVAVTTLLLAAGLGVAGAATTAVVSSYLVGQVDSQLERTAQAVANMTLNDSPSRANLPSEYYVLYRGADGSQARQGWSPVLARYGRPDVPNLTVAEVAERTDEPFTVNSIGGSDPAQWRVAAFVVSNETGAQEGTAFVALPLSGIQETQRILARTLVLAGLAIAVIGGLVAYLAVRRALRPLRQIEATAATIAAGDLSRRIPPEPPSTEVGSLAASLNAMLAHIEGAFATRELSEARMRRFVSDASHELRTPLATIRGYGELYRMGALADTDAVADTMGRIEDAATRMGTLVNDLLALARLDENRPLRQDPVDLLALARDSAQDLHALDPTRTVGIVGLTGDVPQQATVVGDEDRLRQVFANLVGNIAQHTPRGTPAELAVGTDGPVAILEIRDHGPGVAAGHADRVFERFYRADSSRNRTSGGSGLGLAIVAAIVGAHSGTVRVTETTGGGMSVRIELPTGYDDGSPTRS